MTRLGPVRRPEWRSRRSRTEQAERAWRRRLLDGEIERSRRAGGSVPPPEMHR